MKPFGFIYALVDPRKPFTPLYYGQTKNALEARRNAHIAAAKRGENTPRGRGIRALIAEGVLPDIYSVDHGFSADELNRLETHWIATGLDLWNVLPGGGANPGSVMSPTTRARMSIASSRVRSHPEVRANHSRRMKEAWARPEVRARWCAAAKLMNARPDYKEKQRVAMRAAFATPEARARRSEISRAALASPEVRSRLSVAVTAAWARRKGTTHLSREGENHVTSSL